MGQLKRSTIDTMKYMGLTSKIRYQYRNLKTRCPINDENDLFDIEIEFIPRGKIPEINSMRNYLKSLEDKKEYQEVIANQILIDFWKTLKPRYLSVRMVDLKTPEIDTMIIEIKKGKKEK